MPKDSPLPPLRTITKTQARRFLLAHHGLYPPRNLIGKEGILEYIKHVGSIQFDPINVVGRNPDLVLQSRIQDYQPALLDELLYADRKLVDGYDKVASIMVLDDWRYFSRRRIWLNQPDIDLRRPLETALTDVLFEIRKRGPLSSLDFTQQEIVDWYWGPTKIARAALESLFSMGKVGIHHRINNRRVFDLIERLLPPYLLNLPDPFENEEEYQDWHVLRRVAGMGLASAKSGEHWLGILNVKSKERNTIIQRLVNRGALIPVRIREIPEQLFYIRDEDQMTLNGILESSQQGPGAAFIAPLDNLIWDRRLVQQVFNFEYTWEVYKPKVQRKYGYYVLPVIFQDLFIARIEPIYDKNKRLLTIQNWWWENGFQVNELMKEALIRCLENFVAYLGAEKCQFEKNLKNDSGLEWFHSSVDKMK